MTPRTMARSALARVATLIGITVATFLLLELAPGDPADVRLGRGSNLAAVTALRSELGLDGGSVAQRYLTWLGHSLRFDFGRSFVDGRSVRQRLAEALPTTLALGFLAALFGWGLGVPLGCALALARGRRRLAEVGLSLAYALPTASLALIWLRAGAPYGGSATTLVVAALTLSVPLWVRIGRHQTVALESAMRSDWARTARAMGASEVQVLVRHALRHALLPTVTLLTSELPALLSGSVLVEQIFGLRGLGTLGIDAVLARDYPVLLGLGTLGAVLTFAGTAVGEWLLRRLDPRFAHGTAT